MISQSQGIIGVSPIRPSQHMGTRNPEIKADGSSRGGVATDGAEDIGKRAGDLVRRIAELENLFVR